MKFIVLIFTLLYVAPSVACVNYIAQSEIPKAIAQEPNAGAKQCGGDDPCVCFDGIDFETAEWDGKKFSNSKAKAQSKKERIASEKNKDDLEKSRAQRLKILAKKSAAGSLSVTEQEEAVRLLLLSTTHDND